MLQGDGYQTVTILPPESSSGEVSYVLIVQQPDGGEQAVISSEVLDGGEGDVLPGKFEPRLMICRRCDLTGICLSISRR